MSEYMLELRKLVGKRPIFQNGASVIVVNPQKQILLGLRSDNHCWGYAGGSIELGEQLETAAARELFEEFQITAKSLELYGVFSGEDMFYEYPNGDQVYNIDTVFICYDYEGIPKADGVEQVDVAWFDPDELPDQISPPTEAITRQFAANLLKTI